MNENKSCWACLTPAHLSAEIETVYGPLVVWACEQCQEINFLMNDIPQRVVMFDRELTKGLLWFRVDSDGRTIARGSAA